MSTLRKELYHALEAPRLGTLAALVNGFLMTLIVANVVAVILESVQSLHDRYEIWFELFELFSVAVFTVEYFLRLWVCVEAGAGDGSWRERLRYLVTPMALVDLLAVLPFYLSAFVAMDMRFLRALRLIRVFKLSRYSMAMDLLVTVIKNELAVIVSAMFVMLIIVIVAASGIYLIERDSQPDSFQSIPQAMWWAAVTLTTVGYGMSYRLPSAVRFLGFSSLLRALEWWHYQRAFWLQVFPKSCRRVGMRFVWKSESLSSMVPYRKQT